MNNTIPNMIRKFMESEMMAIVPELDFEAPEIDVGSGRAVGI